MSTTLAPTAHGAPAGPGSCAAHRALIAAAARCERAMARFGDEEDPGHGRAREMLAETTAVCRAAGAVFEADPTLVDEPDNTGRLRPVELLAELARQLTVLLPQAVSTTFLDRWPTPARWAEAEALYRRLEELAALIPALVVRRDHDTPAGSRAVSQARLAAHAATVADAAVSIRDAVADALRLPHPAPQALALAELAEQLAGYAADLDALHAAEGEQQHRALWGRP